MQISCETCGYRHQQQSSREDKILYNNIVSLMEEKVWKRIRPKILKDYWPSVRSVLWNIGLRFFSTKKTEVRYFTVQTELEKSINCLLYGNSIFPVAAAILHLNNFDRFLVYYNKFNLQRFDFFPYLPKKVIKFSSYGLIFESVGCENSKHTCMITEAFWPISCSINMQAWRRGCVYRTISRHILHNITWD